MKGAIVLPGDVAEHCRAAANALKARQHRLKSLHDLWADEDPDPENGYFWHVKIEHPEASQLRNDLGKIAEFLEWLAKFEGASDE